MATIGKTFDDPDKWEEPWYLFLSPGKKLLQCYLWGRCDHAGVIHIALPLWCAHTGLSIDEDLLNEFISEVNQDRERIVIFGKKLWFTEYIRFNQQSDPSLPLSDKYSFHKHVFKIIQKHGLVEEINRRDPILLKNFLDDDISISSKETVDNKSYVSLSQELTKPTGKGLVKGKGEESEEGGGHPIPSLQKNESVSTVADRCLKKWSRRADEVFFEEQIMLEDYFNSMLDKGEKLQDLEAGVIGYLTDRKQDGVELIEALEELTT